MGTLARCGAWSASRCSLLLSRALHGEQVAPPAAALWLCAIARSGAEDVDTEKFLDAAESFLADGAGWTADCNLDAARMLWALCALGKASDRNGVGDALLKRLVEADA